MMIIFETVPGLVVFTALILVGFLIYLTMKTSSKVLKCGKCGGSIYVEQMTPENCTECGSKLE